MEFFDREASWAPLTKLLHWLIVALIVALFGIAWVFVWLPFGSPARVVLDHIHEGLGVIALALGVFRILRRFIAPFPAFPPGLSPIERALARSVQVALYAALVIVPLAGWTFASADGEALSLFGLVPIPGLIDKNLPVRDFVWEFHKLGGYVILALLALHLAGALRHHFIERDGLLLGMLPERWSKR